LPSTPTARTGFSELGQEPAGEFLEDWYKVGIWQVCMQWNHGTEQISSYGLFRVSSCQIVGH